MILIRRLSIPCIPGSLPDRRCSITAEISWGKMEDQVAVLRWLDCNLWEWQGKGKSAPRCFVLPLADFPLGLRLSSKGFERGKLIFGTPPCTASHTDGRLRCRIFSNPYSLLA
ncbi:hypothetical protein AVEN_150184-1 [Araneus ventricosus]|uniref:Uncharacterized protein n=1 Tax=Araneus ventricosus TaxID=182803 RepID=A0A4Y2J687_ARAVE|nr:hypothetical protein AVEN_150184-1 [Araneus ventricosus]